MPGIYKRKRPTMNSSYQHDASVWHSTPIDTTNASNDEEGRTLEENVISPLKRPALGRGVNPIVPSPCTVPVTVTSDSQTNSDTSEEINVCSTGSSSLRDKTPEMHISERYGPVVINPPSGHSFFGAILHTNGFILALPKNHLREDIIHFRSNMEKWLNDNSNENSRIEDEATKFMTAVKKYFTIKENLIHSCTTTLNDRECVQPSLLHCLLGVRFVQVPLLKVVLPAVSEASLGNTQEDSDLVSTIINQMKWLPLLVDGKSFAEKMLDVLDTASSAAQKHIIRLLPEIFLPEYHSQLVPRLMALFDLGTQVNVTMLDCFSSLNVPEEDCARIRLSAVDQMTAAPLQDLPSYLSFMFRLGSSVSQLEEGINEMREKLEIIPRTKLPNDDACQVEILERIRFFVSVNPAIIKIWISKVKDDLACNIELKTMDLIMLLIFVEAGDKSATQALTLLFNTPAMINDLFDQMMEHNNPMLQELFTTVARFVDCILRTKNSKCQEAAGDVTRKLFVGLGPVLSQHLTTNLIGVLINGHPDCRDIVLKIFTMIAETDPKKLLYFHNYLMGALVYVIKFPPRQMQALMNILAILAYMPENIQGEENVFTLEFMILLRKQITQSNVRTRCFGVLGTIAAVRQLASHQPCDEEKIDELLALAWSSIEKDEEACSIFFDELVGCVDLLPKQVCQRFRTIINANFERLWTMDQASDSQLLKSSRGQAELELVPTFDANKEMQRDQLIIVLEPQALQMSPLVVPSHFRVMAELERVVENGALEGIDAVLGCPVFFPKSSIYYELPNLDHLGFNQRQSLGQYLILTINYFRECVSAFVDSDNAELRIKVWFRLNSIITMQKLLVRHFDSFPNLPAAYGVEKNLSANNNNTTGAGFSGGFGNANAGKKPGTANKKKAPKPRKKKSKKKKTDENDDEEEEELDDEEELMESEALVINEKPVTNLEDLIQPKSVAPHIRHLDRRVFGLIKYPLKLSGDPVDHTGILLDLSNATQSSQTMQEVEKFEPETLAFLLTEIKQQTLDKKGKLDILAVDDLLVSVCAHIDKIGDFYMPDSEGEVPNHQAKVDSCLHLLINMMELYFAAISNIKDKNRRKSLTDESIAKLGSRYKPSSEESDSSEELFQSQVELLANVSKYISNISNFVGAADPIVAQDHVKLLKIIHDLVPEKEEMKKAIEDTIKKYLRRKWKLPSSVIDYLLKTWFLITDSPLKIVDHLVNHLIVEKSDDDKNPIPNCTVYQSCSKINFHTWYAAIFNGFTQHILKVGRRRGDFEDSMDLWKEGMELFKTLVNISQQFQKSSILVPLLRNSRLYINTFISGGVCLLPELWTKDAEFAQTFTKTLQMSTRRIQNICEHSKVVKDNTLLRLVPLMKKTLETLLFRVREALGNFGAAGAFWMGALKHRNLAGELISSQPFNKSQIESSDDESVSDPFVSGSVPTTYENEDDDEVEDEEDVEDIESDAS